MGWYAAVGRPLFFALPPETAHLVAGSMLGLPLPWRRIGGVSRDPALATELAGLHLANPVGLAAGFDKRCRHLGALGSLGFGYVVGGTITRRARAGNPKPRIARSPRSRSMVNAMGLPNPGAEVAAQHLARDRATAPRFVSIADEASAEAIASFELLEPLADGIELNASCPNVSWGRDRDDEAHLRGLLTAFRARTTKPLMVKLPPFTSRAEREAVSSYASIALDAGVDGLTCSNTKPVEDARLAIGRGGLSGRALWPQTARIVAHLRGVIGEGPAINACGGITTAKDAAACLEAGATTVQVYSALIYEGPGVLHALTSGLAQRGPVLRRR